MRICQSAGEQLCKPSIKATNSLCCKGDHAHQHPAIQSGQPTLPLPVFLKPAPWKSKGKCLLCAVPAGWLFPEDIFYKSKGLFVEVISTVTCTTTQPPLILSKHLAWKLGILSEMSWRKRKKNIYMCKLNLSFSKNCRRKFLNIHTRIYTYNQRSAVWPKKKAALQYSKQVGICNIHIWTFCHIKTKGFNWEQ